ncbi:MAG: GAF domain-containing protein [Anaerolineae bacterium]|nr:GAF domain-containing protein [Anaerolineae bacterium]
MSWQTGSAEALAARIQELEREVADCAANNQRLVDDTRRRVAQLTALQETTRAVASTLDQESLLRLIIQQATSLLSGEGGLLNLVRWEAYEDEVVAGCGSMTFAIGERSPLGESLSGWVTLNKQADVSNSLGADPRVHRSAKAWVDQRQVRNAALAPLEVSGRVIGSLVVVNKRNGQSGFDQGDLDLLQSFADQAATAIRNAQLYAAEQRRADQFRVIGEVSGEITTIMPVDEILARVAHLVRDTFDYYHVGIGLVEGDEVVYRVGAGNLWESMDFKFKPSRLKIGRQGLTGWVAQTGQAIVVSDVRLDDRYVRMEGTAALSEIVVPILVKGRVIGVLDVQSRRVDAFDETDLQVLQSLAHQTGAAIENTQLYEQAQQAAVLEERSRLARDLHDAVTQTLFSASLLAEVLPATWEMDQARGRELLQELRQLSRGALAEMRTLLLELRPNVLAEADLGDLLRQLAEAVAGRTGMAVQVTVDPACELPDDVRIALYRIAQEALNNVVKHARAEHALVELRCRDVDDSGRNSTARLVIHDDGIGFDVNAVPPDRLGLGIICERTSAISAALTLDSDAGQGTTITVVWQAAAPGSPEESQDAAK